MDQPVGTPSAVEKAFGLAAPQLTLPRGGGGVRGIGEKFAANPVTGTGSLTVPIVVSRGRSDFGPQLNLSYDSGSGNVRLQANRGRGRGLSQALIAASRVRIFRQPTR
jgi:hypothetical protein